MKKAPKLFRKAIKKKKFEKKILKFAFVKENKDFLIKNFTLKDGYYHPSELSGKKDTKKLKKISKTIKKNQGFIKSGKLTLLGIILTGLIIFYLAFMSPIVENSAEKLFSRIFEAKVDFESFNFNPLAGSISFSKLTVGDKNNEFKNLFELGPSKLDINTEALLRKKFVIENISATELALGTERTSSGFLKKAGDQGIEKGEGEEQKSKEEPSGFDNFISALQVDAKGIVEREAKNLKSLQAVEKLPAVYEAKINSYTELFNKSESEIKQISKTAIEISSININALGLKDIPTIIKLVTNIESDIKNAEALVKEYSNAVSSIEKDIKSVSSDINSIKKSVDTDINYIMSFFDLSSGNTQRIGSELIDKQLSRYLGSTYSTIKDILHYTDRIKLSQGEKADEIEADRDKGTKVYFPAQKYPSFWLQKMLFNMKDKSFGLEITDISSEPELVNKASTFSTFVNSDDLNLEADGFLDLREESEQRFGLDIVTKGIELNLSEELKDLEISTFVSELSVNASTIVYADGKLSGKAELVINNINAVIINDPSPLGQFFQKILSHSDKITVSANFTISAAEGLSLKIDTNLNAIISNTIKGIIDDLKKRAQKEVTTYVNQMIEPYRKQLEGYKNQINSTLKKYSSQFSEIKEYVKMFEDKKKALKRKQSDLQLGGAADTVTDLLQGLSF